MTFRFGAFVLNQGARQLLRHDRPLHLSPKAFDLLSLLLTRRPEAISKREIHHLLWPDTFVSDVNIAVLIAEIRQALDESSRRAGFVRTVHRFGYAFAGKALEVQRPGRRAGGDAGLWLAWTTGRASLKPGDNIVGRDPQVDVRVEAVGVSRRHALIVVSGEAAILHDLASKNGTYVEGVRVTSPKTLVDGAEIRLGSAPVRFRRIAPGGSTETVF
jgi:DNA-binding winged helix-turn-helix (wHTH) protein